MNIIAITEFSHEENIFFLILTVATGVLVALGMVLNHRERMLKIKLDREPKVVVNPPPTKELIESVGGSNYILYGDNMAIKAVDQTFGGDTDPFLFRWKGDEVYTVQMLSDAMRSLQSEDEARELRRLVLEHGWGQGGIEAAVRDVYPDQLVTEIEEILLTWVPASCPKQAWEGDEDRSFTWDGARITTFGDLAGAIKQLAGPNEARDLREDVERAGWHKDSIEFVINHLSPAEIEDINEEALDALEART